MLPPFTDQADNYGSTSSTTCGYNAVLSPKDLVYFLIIGMQRCCHPSLTKQIIMDPPPPQHVGIMQPPGPKDLVYFLIIGMQRCCHPSLTKQIIIREDKKAWFEKANKMDES